SPEVLGAHLEAVERGAAVSVEAVERERTDRGGCVARIGDRPAIVEGFRLPESVEISSYALFNTNTLWFTLAAIREPTPLDWFAVHRAVAGPDGAELPIIQFEQLVGQITEFVPSCFLRVDRGSRFLPVKTRADLEAMSTAIASIVDAARAR
ncbi:MAG: UTP--glucose-1-phosphate uridylyltransferase, partial [Nannocystaceae bacterium]